MRDGLPRRSGDGKNQANLLADGILVWPIAVREGFVNQRDALGIRPVGRSEGTAFFHGTPIVDK